MDAKEIENAYLLAEQKDAAEAAGFFKEKIGLVFATTSAKSESNWSTTAVDFLSKFYPLARASLQVTSLVAEVSIGLVITSLTIRELISSH